MIENEIVQPKRKRQISETEEKTAAKKTGRSRKTAEKKIELKESDLVRAEKPVKKTRARKKTPASPQEEIAIAEKASTVSLEQPPVELKSPESVRDVETKNDDSISVAKPRRRKATAAKKAVEETISSPVRKRAPRSKKEKTVALETLFATLEAEKQIQEETAAPAPSKDAPVSSKKEESPIFRELAEPKLPVLPQENRARLQMQSPNRIFFYWSVKHNPFETLTRAFAGRAANYTLVIKLVNLNNNTEEVYPVEPLGSWWFNVDSNTSYRAEVGFFAQNRPFIRLMYSNAVETPRSAPSPNADWSTDFAVTASEFAEVLDAAGYAQDAFEVIIAGDDQQTSDEATQNAFFRLVGKQNLEINANELRSVLLALASGVSLESLRGQISPSLFALIEAIMRENSEKLSAEKVLAALHENFEFEDEAEEFSAPVFGASAINFPRKPRFPKFSPVSSLR